MRLVGWFLLVIAGTSRVEALPPIDLRIQGELPFTKTELSEQVRLRLPLVSTNTRGAVPATVRGDGKNRVLIHVGHHIRRARLQPGAGQARMVALLLLDLMTDEHRQREAHVAKEARPGPVGPPRFQLELVPTLSFMAQNEHMGAEPTLGIGLRLYRGFWGFIEGGYSWTPTIPDDWEGTELRQVPLRTGLAFRHRWFEARGGLALRPFWLDGMVSDEGVRVGGTVALRFIGTIGRSLVLFGTLGADLFPGGDLYLVRRQSSVDAGTWEPPSHLGYLKSCVGGLCTEEWGLVRTNHVIPYIGVGIGFVGGR